MASRKTCKVLEVPSATLIYLLTFFVYCHILPKKQCLLFLILFKITLFLSDFPEMAALNSTVLLKTHCGPENVCDQEQQGFCFFPTDALVKSWCQLHVSLLSKSGVTRKKSAWKSAGLQRRQCAIQFNGVRLVLKVDQQTWYKTDFSAR